MQDDVNNNKNFNNNEIKTHNNDELRVILTATH